MFVFYLNKDLTCLHNKICKVSCPTKLLYSVTEFVLFISPISLTIYGCSYKFKELFFKLLHNNNKFSNWGKHFGNSGNLFDCFFQTFVL